MDICVCLGYRWNPVGLCLPYCSDSLTIQPHEACDDGNLAGGDGCNDFCQQEDNFTCVVDNMTSSCNFSGTIDMTLKFMEKDPYANTLLLAI